MGEISHAETIELRKFFSLEDGQVSYRQIVRECARRSGVHFIGNREPDQTFK